MVPGPYLVEGCACGLAWHGLYTNRAPMGCAVPDTFMAGWAVPRRAGPFGQLWCGLTRPVSGIAYLPNLLCTELCGTFMFMNTDVCSLSEPDLGEVVNWELRIEWIVNQVTMGEVVIYPLLAPCAICVMKCLDVHYLWYSENLRV